MSVVSRLQPRPRAALATLTLAGLVAASGQARAELFPSTATEVQSPGACRSELWINQYETRWQDQKLQGYAGSTELGCGVTDRLDLRLAVNHSDSEFWHSNQARFGARLRLLGNARDATLVTLGANISAAGFGGSADEDGFRYRSLGIELAARHESGGHRFEGRLGHTRPRQGRSLEDWALSYAYAIHPAWELLADTRGGTGLKATNGLGLRWNASPHWQFAAQLEKTRAGEGFSSPPLSRTLAARWTPSRAWQLTGTLSHRPASSPTFGEFFGVGLNLRHDF